MALFTRIGRLFKADLHAVIDQLEEPYSLLRQSIREMETALTQDEDNLSRATQRCKEVQAKTAQLAQASAQLDEELDICLAADNDDLARALIKRKLEQAQLITLLTTKEQQLSEDIKSLRTTIEQRRPQLDSMRQKTELFAEELTKPTGDLATETGAMHVTRDAIEVALLREKQKRAK